MIILAYSAHALTIMSIIIYGLAFILFMMGLVKESENKDSAISFYILGLVLFIIGFGVCTEAMTTIG